MRHQCLHRTKKSSHKYKCDDRLKTCYWNQCILKVHSKGSGLVTKDCSCNPSTFTTRTNNSLPAKCYSPCGDSCNWYGNCLEQKYLCEATTNVYMLRYPEKFFKLNDYRYTLFSAEMGRCCSQVSKAGCCTVTATLEALIIRKDKRTCVSISRTMLRKS